MPSNVAHSEANDFKAASMPDTFFTRRRGKLLGVATAD